MILIKKPVIGPKNPGRIINAAKESPASNGWNWYCLSMNLGMNWAKGVSKPSAAKVRMMHMKAGRRSNFQTSVKTSLIFPQTPFLASSATGSGSSMFDGLWFLTRQECPKKSAIDRLQNRHAAPTNPIHYKKIIIIIKLLAFHWVLNLQCKKNFFFCK